jgi:hypothetical protein
MSHTLHFLPEVEEDVMVAYAWYEGKSAGLGAEFLRVFYATASEVQRAPLAYAQIHGEFRRGLLRRFPYACYFQAMEGRIIVFGLFHCARDPSTVAQKIQGRHVP